MHIKGGVFIIPASTPSPRLRPRLSGGPRRRAIRLPDMAVGAVVRREFTLLWVTTPIACARGRTPDGDDD